MKNPMSVFRNVARQAPRVAVHIPAVAQVIVQNEQTLHPNLAKVYERVMPAENDIGRTFPTVIQNLSTNGAFLAGTPVALLSRVTFSFPLAGYGQVEVIGWTMWRRTAACEIPRDGQDPLELGPGFGVLFEAMPMEARVCVSEMVKKRT